MANGYCEALLLHLDSIAGQNYPGKKVTPPGFVNMLLQQPNRPTTIQEAYQGGHRRDVRIKYKVRTTEGQVSTSDTCALDLVPLYKETTASVDNIAQIGLFISDDTVRQYCEEASRTVAIGQPASSMMAEHLDSVLHAFNGIYQKMETVTTTSMASLFGKHVATGTATAVSVNIEQDSTLNDLTTGLTKMLTDFEANEFCGTPMFVGALGGLMHSYDVQFRNRVMSVGDGFNAQALADAMGFQFFASGRTGTTWGAQHVGMFAPESVHLIERLDNVGSFAGNKGNSTFGTIIDPRVQCWTPNGLSNVQFDFQMKYIDCPEEVAGSLSSGYINESNASGRGYFFAIKKRYGLFTTPTDAFDGADRMAGSNGSLRYVISNS